MKLLIHTTFIIFFTLTFFSCNYVATFETTSEKDDYTLPDETIVLLDQESSLSYKKNFNRRILEILGKAYIEIAYVEDEDFVLEYEQLEILLKGDDFYIHTNQDENKVIFIPIDGYARAEIKGISGQSIMTIKEGYLLEYESEKHVVQIREVINQNYLSWKNEAFYFSNVKLNEVVETLGEEFDTQIKLSSKILEECNITDTITNYSIDSALTKIVSITGTELKQTDKSYILVGDSCKADIQLKTVSIE